MHPILLNSIAIVGGLFLGSVVNMSLIALGGELVPAPTGVDVSTMESLSQAMHSYEPKHFLFPFLAHAFGTLSGAIFAAKTAASHQLKIALIIGIAFLAGGITMVVSLPSPIWFNTIDLLGAYLPMAYIGYRLVANDDTGKSNHAE